jgi:hypothetical protein
VSWEAAKVERIEDENRQHNMGGSISGEKEG